MANPFEGFAEEVKTTNNFEGFAEPTQPVQPTTNQFAGFADPVDIKPEEEKVSLLGDLKNIVFKAGEQVLRGTLDAYGFTQKFTPQQIGQAIGQSIQEGDTNATQIFGKVLENKNIQQYVSSAIPEVAEPQYRPDIFGFKDVPVGELAADLLGFAGAYGSLARGVTTTGARTLPEMVKQGGKVLGLGAVAEQVAFSPYEQRISNAIQERIPNQFTEFLQADPDDDEATARFKMALEGSIIGVPIEGLFRVAGKVRAAKKIDEQPDVEVPDEQAIVKSDDVDIPTKTETVQTGPYAGAKVERIMSVAEATAQKESEALIKKKNPFKFDEATGITTAKIKNKEVQIQANEEGRFDLLQQDTRTDKEINDALEQLFLRSDITEAQSKEAAKRLKEEKIFRPLESFDTLEQAKVNAFRILDPNRLPKQLRPTKKPPMRRAKDYLVGAISPNSKDMGEFLQALEGKSGRLPPAYYARKGDTGNSADGIIDDMQQDGYYPPAGVDAFGTTRGSADTFFTDININRPHPEDLQRRQEWEIGEQGKIERIKELESYGYNPYLMTDADVDKAFKQINKNEDDLTSIANKIEEENIAKQQTDEIYQQTIANERLRSVRDEGVPEAPPLEVTELDELPPSFIEKDFGISKYPKRQTTSEPSATGKPLTNNEEKVLKNSWPIINSNVLQRKIRIDSASADKVLDSLERKGFLFSNPGIGPDGKTIKVYSPTIRANNYPEFADKIKYIGREPADRLPTGEAPDDKFAGNINLDKINEPKEIKSIIKKIAKENDSFKEARRGVVKFGSKGENLEALARTLNVSDAELLKRKIGQAFNSEEVYAARLLFDEALKDAYDLSTIAKSADASQVDLVRFENAMARVASIQEQIAGITAEAGRALRSFREAVGPASSKNPKVRDKIIQDYIKSSGGTARIQDIAKKMSMLEDEAQLAKFARDRYKPTFNDYVQEYWINSLLSSPSTHIVNILSNTLVAGLTPLEYFGSALIGKLRKGGDKITFGEAGARLLGSVYGALDGVRAAKKAIVEGEVLDPMTKLELQRQEAIPGPLGSVIRVPGKALVAEDAFFKSIGYRQELWGRAFRQAQKEGKGLKRAYELMKNPDEWAPDVHLDAIQAGRYQTFTEPLGDGRFGTLGSALQKAIAKMPALRYIFPFVRTPVNIVRYAFERFPGTALFTTRYREAIARGGREADLARAKLAVGSTITAGVVTHALAGNITGRGPSDFRERAVMFETGWQPYSIRVGDKYYSYNRFEPIGILFGITADMVDIYKYVEEAKLKGEEDALLELGSMIIASVTENITNKTFLTGLSDAIQILNDPDRYASDNLRRFAGSFIPTVVAYERKSDDPILRDVQSYGDAIANRFPEVFGNLDIRTSQDLSPKRNVFGDVKTYKETFGGKYSPVNVSSIKNDVVFNEFVNLGYTPPFPRRLIGGVKLNSEQYEDLLYQQKLLGTKQLLQNFIQSPGYKLIPKQAKIDKINDIILERQKKAREIIQAKYKEIIGTQVEEVVEEIKEI